MENSDKASFRIDDIWIALGLLTRLPMPKRDWDTERPAAMAAWAYPLVGLIVAAMSAAGAFVMYKLGTSAGVVAGVALIVSVLTTGAMHEDGLADSADGLWGGEMPERRLEIMKDSRIGAYGVIALILGFGLRWTALSTLIAAGAVFAPLIVAATLSRTAMAYVMDVLPNARDNGLSQMTGRPGKPATRGAAGVAAAIAVLCFGWNGVWLLLLAAAVVIGCARFAQVKIGGQTGDILGATQQITEIALLIAMTTLI